MLYTMSTKQILANAVRLFVHRARNPNQPIAYLWDGEKKSLESENWLCVILLIPGISFAETVFWEAGYISIRCVYTEALCDSSPNFKDMESVFEI